MPLGQFSLSLIFFCFVFFLYFHQLWLFHSEECLPSSSRHHSGNASCVIASQPERKANPFLQMKSYKEAGKGRDALIEHKVN